MAVFDPNDQIVVRGTRAFKTTAIAAGDSLKVMGGRIASKSGPITPGQEVLLRRGTNGQVYAHVSEGLTPYTLLFRCMCCNADRTNTYTPEYVIGQLLDYSIVISYDYGANWQKVANPINYAFLDIVITHGNTIYGRGSSGSFNALAVSKNNGKTWAQLYNSSIVDVTSLMDPSETYIKSLRDIVLGTDGELWALDKQMMSSEYPIFNPGDGLYRIWKNDSGGAWTSYTIAQDWLAAGQSGNVIYDENLIGWQTNPTNYQLPTYNRSTSSAAWAGGLHDPITATYGQDALFPRKTRTANYAWTIAYPLEDWDYRCQRLYRITPELVGTYVGTYDTFTLHHYRDLTSNFDDTLVNVQNTWAADFQNPITPYKVEYSIDEGANWQDSGMSLPANAMDRVFWLGADWYGIIDTTGALTRFQIPS